MTGTPGSDDISTELVRRARRGDREALEALVDRAYPLVRRWSLVHTGDPAEADDLTQDVLVQVIRRIHTFQGDARFSSWLYAVTRNAALDRHRKLRRRGALRAVPDVDTHTRPAREPSPLRDAERAETRTILDDFLHALPPRQREVVELIELQGMDSHEAAGLMGIEAVSVRAHLHKARKALRRRILAERPHLAEEAP